MAIQLIRGQTIGGQYYPPLQIVEGLTPAVEQQLIQGGDASRLNNLTVFDGTSGVAVLADQANDAAARAAVAASPLPAGTIFLVPVQA